MTNALIPDEQLVFDEAWDDGRWIFTDRDTGASTVITMEDCARYGSGRLLRVLARRRINGEA